jgi:hypothetical protein
MKKTTDEDELRPEYELKTMRIVERGPSRSPIGKTITLEPDVALMFPTSEAVNEALRQIIRGSKPGNTVLGS